jgi:hypothetical protein
MALFSTDELLSDLQADEQLLKDHREAFKTFFEGSVDFEAIFDLEDFNVFTNEPSKEHMARIGLKLVVAYRDSFEEDNEYWRDI